MNTKFLKVLFSALFLMVTTPLMAQPVQIDGPSGPLAGTAIAVDGARHAVVIIPGSGPVDRDGNNARTGLSTNSYAMLADGLAARGIASIRIDKRGMFASSAAIADANDVTVAAYAEDARRWVGRAAQLAPCVWIAGHSEGGLVALAAAKAAPERLCGLILLSTPGRPAGLLLLEQLRAMPGMADHMPDIERIVADLEAGGTSDVSGLPQNLQAIFAPAVQGYLIDLMRQDPREMAANWPGPVLIVQGDADIQIGAGDADLLAEAMPQAERADLPDATHMLKPDVPGRPMATYTDPSRPLHPELIPAIAGFLERNAGSP